MICLSSLWAQPFIFLFLVLLATALISWMSGREREREKWRQSGSVRGLTLLLVLSVCGSIAALWFLVEALRQQNLSYVLAAVLIGGLLVLTGSRLRFL